jgi:hypothetical protein
MARLKLKQVLSNLSYDASSNKLTVSGSNYPSLVVSGAVDIVSTPTLTGSLNIQNIDSFGDSGSFYTVDLGDY